VVDSVPSPSRPCFSLSVVFRLEGNLFQTQIHAGVVHHPLDHALDAQPRAETPQFWTNGRACTGHFGMRILSFCIQYLHSGRIVNLPWRFGLRRHIGLGFFRPEIFMVSWVSPGFLVQ